MGIIVEVEGKIIYYIGDIGLFSDMKLIVDRYLVDVCFVFIGDNFIMGIEDVSYVINEFIKFIISVFIYYNIFLLIE